jgi:hypothetical protein
MAKPSRRSVLRSGVVLVAASAPLGVAQHAMSVVAGGVASGLRRSTFKPHVGTTFSLSDGGATYAAVLRRVADVKTAARGHDKKFRLVFEVKGAAPQGTYRLKHPRIAAMDLFVAPTGGKAGVYEAVVDAA